MVTADECLHEWQRDRLKHTHEQVNAFTCAKCGADKLRWAEARIAVLEAEVAGWQADHDRSPAEGDLTITIDRGVVRWSPTDMSKERVLAHLANVIYLHRKRGDKLERALRCVERTL